MRTAPAQDPVRSVASSEGAVPLRTMGRYALFARIASGGMGTVHLGRLLGAVGFARTVAIKRLHAQYARDGGFVKQFTDEARLAARIRHPNVVATLDVVSTDDELFIVIDYVHGETLSRLVEATKRASLALPPRVAVAVIAGALHGLHAAHEATNERGGPLGIVHRDVSPQNIMVGVDGVARVLDFGVAHAADRLQTTKDGALKGKLGYMAPENVRRRPIDRRADVYAAAVVLWEMLTLRRLFDAESEVETFTRVLYDEVAAPSEVAGSAPELDAIVMKGLARDPAERFSTAREMAVALEEALPPATSAQVGQWVEELARDALAARTKLVSQVESAAVDAVQTASTIVATAHPKPAHPLEPEAETAKERATQKYAQRAAETLTETETETETETLAKAPPEPERTALMLMLSPPPNKVEHVSRGRVPPRAARAARVAVALAILGVSAAIGFAVTRRQLAPDSTVVQDEPSTVAITPSLVASAPPPPPAPEASMGTPALASATTSPTGTRGVSAPKRRTASPAKSAAPAPPASVPGPADPCAIPYAVDGLGRKIYKRECL